MHATIENQFKTIKDIDIVYNGLPLFIPKGTRVVRRGCPSCDVYYADDLSFFRLPINMIKFKGHEPFIAGATLHDATYYGISIDPELIVEVKNDEA